MASGVFFGFSPASSAPAPGALTGVNVSSVLIHFGMLASLSSRGRPRHCLTPTSSSSRTPERELEDAHPRRRRARVARAGAARDRQDDRADDRQADDPAGHEGRPFARPLRLTSMSTTATMAGG